jgi:hypothetical protein
MMMAVEEDRNVVVAVANVAVEVVREVVASMIADQSLEGLVKEQVEETTTKIAVTMAGIDAGLGDNNSMKRRTRKKPLKVLVKRLLLSVLPQSHSPRCSTRTRSSPPWFDTVCG